MIINVVQLSAIFVLITKLLTKSVIHPSKDLKHCPCVFLTLCLVGLRGQCGHSGDVSDRNDDDAYR